jgi:Fur family zinc uptake transcriptional regulator
MAEELKSAARAAGFVPKAPVIEISGVCAHCRQHEHAG